MIKLDFTGRKKLKFHVQVWGTNLSALRGVFVIMDNNAGDSGVEYRFNGKLENDSIGFLLPPLNKIIARPVENDTVMRAYLEVMGEGLYNIPWRDEILIKVREARVETVEQGEEKVERKTNTETKQPVLEIEDEAEDKVEGKDDDGDKVDESANTEDKIQSIISQMRKFNAVKEVEKVVKPVKKLFEDKKEKKVKPEVTQEVTQEVKEEKEVLKENINKEPKIVASKKDKKRHEKKVIASLLSVANQ